MTPVTATGGVSETGLVAGLPEARATVAPVVCGAPRKNGEPCQSRILLEDGLCNLHSPTSTVDPAAIGRIGGLNSVETRREQSKSVRDRLRERVEENVDRIWAAFESGLASDDERVQIVAATSLLAEAYGKPAVAITGGDQPVTFQLVSLLAQVRELEEGDPSA